MEVRTGGTCTPPSGAARDPGSPASVAHRPRERVAAGSRGDRARQFPLTRLLQNRDRRALAVTLGEQLRAAATEVFLDHPQ